MLIVLTYRINACGARNRAWKPSALRSRRWRHLSTTGPGPGRGGLGPEEAEFEYSEYWTAVFSLVIKKPSTKLSSLAIKKPSTKLYALVIKKLSTKLSGLVITKPSTKLSNLVIKKPSTRRSKTKHGGFLGL